MSERRTPAAELRGIEKRFGPVRANRSISLTLARGSIHGLVGENGAGKSTLAQILYGYLRPDAGEIRIGGRPVAFGSPRDAIAAGVGMVHQHFMLVEPMTVLENLMLGREAGLGLAEGRASALATLARLDRGGGTALDPEAKVENLPVGSKQRVEILKALHRGAEILILDEPTAVLTPLEATALFGELRALAEHGKTILLVTHRLREVIEVTDAVTVLRQGEVVAERQTRDTDAAELAALMIGRSPSPPQRRPARLGPLRLEIRELTVRDGAGILRLDRASLAVRGGEIVAIAGVAGNGQSELIESLVGLTAPESGSIRLDDVELIGLTVRERRLRGLGHVAEDRLRLGAVADFSAVENALLGCEQVPQLLRRAANAGALEAAMAAYDVRPAEPERHFARFSGGNQQKLVVARELGRTPAVLVAGQPTRGVDVGAAELIHNRLLELRDAGSAILLISADLEEIRLLADRILVLCGGRIAGELTPETADERQLGLLMAGAASA